jgi:hypothetical protein
VLVACTASRRVHRRTSEPGVRISGTLDIEAPTQRLDEMLLEVADHDIAITRTRWDRKSKSVDVPSKNIAGIPPAPAG